MTKLLVSALALLLIACDQQSKYPVHQVPAGYEGYVVVIFDQPGYPELPSNRKNQFLRYPADGILITSSPSAFGSHADQAIETIPEVENDRVRKVGRARQYESFGTRDRNGIYMPYLVKAITGGPPLGDSIDLTAKVEEAEQKVNEAEQKLRRGLGQ